MSAALPPELDPRGRRGATPAHARASAPRSDLRRGGYIGLMVVLSLLAGTVLVAGGWSWWTYRKFSDGLKRVDVITTGGTDIDGKDQNILIVGNDDRQTATDAELRELGTQRDGGSLNTDTMMLLHVPANGRKATLVSFPRDSYVAIPGHGSNKLNSAYPTGYRETPGAKIEDKRAGGGKLLVRTIEDLTGAKIDHFVQVDLLGFYRISNAIGGVPVVLCAAQKEANSGIDLPAGRSVIKGKQALAFVRQRYGLKNGDLDRIKRQQYFLTAAFRQIASTSTLTNPSKLQRLLNAVRVSLQLDKTLDPLELARQVQGLTADNIVTRTIPTDGFDTNEAGSVVVVRPDAVKAFISMLFSDKSATPTTAVPPSSVTVDVLNGGAAAGSATKSANVLGQLGFAIGNVGDTTATAHTTIRYPADKKAGAQALATRIAGVTLTQDDTVQNVTLVLGSDNLVPKPPSGSSSAPKPSSSSARNTPAGCIN